MVGCTVSYSRQSTPGFIIDTFRHAGTGHPLGGIAVTGLSSPLVTAPNEIYSGVSAYAYERTAVIEESVEDLSGGLSTYRWSPWLRAVGRGGAAAGGGVAAGGRGG